ncbi:hypothetical protein D0511_09395 [Pseudoalteromonas piscicida]|uniref:Uncharacterized protein n=1 Tax=Pseudoalteromonas piscicida TaxID=43662 RepID=A0AAD0W3G9_PSEO7|nr:hypothetical protein D0511_09395 [Pseudoalteromonas piscicida]
MIRTFSLERIAKRQWLPARHRVEFLHRISQAKAAFFRPCSAF